jgi:hypothetical protein
MKKLLLILLLPLAMASCKTPTYTIGMTEAEFTLQKKARTALVERTAHRVVYKRYSGQICQYFYFVDGKLVRIAASEFALGEITINNKEAQ